MREHLYGIDFLKMISMFMVVVGHLLVHGNVLNTVIPYSSQYWVAWFMEVVVYCAVDCFALTSGYLMVNSSIKISRLLEIWLQVLFYSFVIAIVMALKFADVRNSIKIVNIVLPITYKEYWYLTAYFGLYLIIPILNTALHRMSRKDMKQTLLFIILFFIAIPTITSQDPYNINSGYSMIWLSILYLFGGYIAKYEIFGKTKRILLLAGFVFSTLTTFFPLVSSTLWGIPLNGYILTSYTSPTVILSAIFLFSFCKGIKFHRFVRKVCLFGGGNTIGILIISDNNLIRNKFLVGGDIARFCDKNAVIMGASVLLCSLMIYLICFGIDIVRMRLFKFLRVKAVCTQLEFWLYSVCEKYKFKTKI